MLNDITTIYILIDTLKFLTAIEYFFQLIGNYTTTIQENINDNKHNDSWNTKYWALYNEKSVSLIKINYYNVY